MLDRRRLRAFILGGLTGALAGVILTPKSGRKLRGDIAERVGEAREKGRESYFESRELMQERLTEVREGPRRAGEAEGETTLEPGTGESAPESPEPGGPNLRDVSRETAEEPSGEESPGEPTGDRSEELRRKVRETRERLGKRTGDEGE